MMLTDSHMLQCSQVTEKNRQNCFSFCKHRANSFVIAVHYSDVKEHRIS